MHNRTDDDCDKVREEKDEEEEEEEEEERQNETMYSPVFLCLPNHKIFRHS